MSTLLNAKERTFEEFQNVFFAADERFELKQWGEAGGPPSSGKCSLLHQTHPSSIYLSSLLRQGKNN